MAAFGAYWAKTVWSNCSRPRSNALCRSEPSGLLISSAGLVDSTVQPKALAHSVDSRLLEIARHEVIGAARPPGYAHAKQIKRLRKTVKRQRTILGEVIREAQRKPVTS